MTGSSNFKKNLILRTRQARKSSGYTQNQMADALGIERAAYAQYERRSMLPHSLIAEFCELTDIDCTYFLTGKNTSLPSPQYTAKQKKIAEKIMFLEDKEQDALKIIINSIKKK